MITKERIRERLKLKGSLNEISLEHLNTKDDLKNLIESYDEVILYNEDDKDNYFLQRIAYETDDNGIVLVFDEKDPNEQ